MALKKESQNVMSSCKMDVADSDPVHFSFVDIVGVTRILAG